MLGTPYENPLYQPAAPWANSSTYAPFATPNSATGQNPFAGYGQTDSGPGYFDMGWATATNPTDFFHSLGAWDFKGGKKRSTPNFYAPSYQGSLFTPQEGLPQWYNQSAEGSAADMLLQSSLSAPQPQSTEQSQQQAASPYDYGTAYQPYFIGGGMDYAAASGLAPSSLGGYRSYGGYGSSGSVRNSSQPFVPTGYGQY